MPMIAHEPKWEPAELPIDSHDNTRPGLVCTHRLENGCGTCPGNVFELTQAIGTHSCWVDDFQLSDDGGQIWHEVTKEQYIAAERANGFNGRPGEPATTAWSNGTRAGRMYPLTIANSAAASSPVSAEDGAA